MTGVLFRQECQTRTRQRPGSGRRARKPLERIPVPWSHQPMSAYRYLIVGGGMTADAAAHGIRELDADGAIGLISAESDPPYNRPPLTKGLWKGDALASIWRKTGDAAIDLHLGRRVTGIDVASKSVTDDH